MNWWLTSRWRPLDHGINGHWTLEQKNDNHKMFLWDKQYSKVGIWITDQSSIQMVCYSYYHSKSRPFVHYSSGDLNSIQFDCYSNCRYRSNSGLWNVCYAIGSIFRMASIQIPTVLCFSTLITRYKILNFAWHHFAFALFTFLQYLIFFTQPKHPSLLN